MKPVGVLTCPLLDATPLDVADGEERTGDLLHPAVAPGQGGANLVFPPGLEGALAEQLAQLELLEEEEGHLTEIGLVTV